MVCSKYSAGIVPEWGTQLLRIGIKQRKWKDLLKINTNQPLRSKNLSIKQENYTELFSFLQQKREGKQVSCQSLNWSEAGVLEVCSSCCSCSLVVLVPGRWGKQGSREKGSCCDNDLCCSMAASLCIDDAHGLLSARPEWTAVTKTNLVSGAYVTFMGSSESIHWS